MPTHKLRKFTMETAVTYYPQLRAAIKYVAPADVGINWTSPYVETNYSLPSFAQCESEVLLILLTLVPSLFRPSTFLHFLPSPLLSLSTPESNAI